MTLFHLYYIQRPLISCLSRGPLRWPLWGQPLEAVYLQEECLCRMEPHPSITACPSLGRAGGTGGAEARLAGRGLTPGAPAQLGPLEGQACLPRAGPFDMSGLWGFAHSAWRGPGAGKLGCRLGGAWRPAGDVWGVAASTGPGHLPGSPHTCGESSFTVPGWTPGSVSRENIAFSTLPAYAERSRTSAPRGHEGQ